MKTYLSNLLPRLQQFSETLDRKEILVDQPWVLVDDNLNKVQYIFRRDGTLIMSLNGNAVTGKWEYIASAKSLLLDAGGKKLLLNHGFVEKGILALKKDGFQDTPWILINERIVPDLDAEKYLNNLLRSKLHIKSEAMESGTFLEFSDPYSTGIQVGTLVKVNGRKAVDGIYKSTDRNLSYEVYNGTVVSVFRLCSFETDKGTIVVRRSPFANSDIIRSRVFLNGIPAPDGKYLVNKDGIRYFIIESHIIQTINRKVSIPTVIALFAFVCFVGILAFIISGKNSESGLAGSPEAINTNVSAPGSEDPVDTVAFKPDPSLPASDYDVKSKLAGYFDAVNDHNEEAIKGFFAPHVSRFFKRTNISPADVVDAMSTYNATVVVNPRTSCDLDSMVVTRMGESYFVFLPQTDFSTLRSNNVPYVYFSETEIRLDKDLKIFYVDGKVVRKSINFPEILNIQLSSDGQLLTRTDQDFFNSAFGKLESPYEMPAYKNAIKEGLIWLTSPSVEISVNDGAASEYLPDFCDNLINNAYNFDHAGDVFRSGDQLYKVSVYITN